MTTLGLRGISRRRFLHLSLLGAGAAAHGITVTEVLDRFLSRLRDRAEKPTIHPEVRQISGLLPADVDARVLYHEHLMEKHR